MYKNSVDSPAPFRYMMDMVEAVPPAAPPSLFEEQTTRVIERLRRAVAEVAKMGDPGSAPGGRPVDLATRLKMDTQLAWKITRLTDTESPFDAARYVPGKTGFQIFLRAARRNDVSKAAIASAKAAYDGFSDLVHTHAGNRRAFEVMLGQHAREDRIRADLEYRRISFEGNSYIWGMQARVALRVDVIGPSDDPMMTDFACVKGFLDLRRLRPNVPWRIGRDIQRGCARGVPH